MIQKGFFVFEGIDGAGTTTQLRIMETRAQESGLPLVIQAEPTGSPVGQMVRKILKGEINTKPGTLARLFAADRYEHVWGPRGIRELTDQGKKVLSDRYFFSSLAYQTLDLEWDEVWNLNQDFPWPEAVFFFSLDVETAFGRVTRRGGDLDIFEKVDLQEKVRVNYARIWQFFRSKGMEIIELDSSQAISVLSDQIWSRLCR